MRFQQLGCVDGADTFVPHPRNDVVYVIFLQPYETDAITDTFSKIVTWLTTNLQPSPPMWHVEIMVPCGHKDERLFATYIGDKAAWRGAQRRDLHYYEITNGQWRAIPLFYPGIALRAHAACCENVGNPYSMCRYASSCCLLRDVCACCLSSEPGTPAHCANVTARILQQAAPDSLQHSPSQYGPATLYIELLKKAKQAELPAMAASDSAVSDAHQITTMSIIDLQQLSTDSALASLMALAISTDISSNEAQLTLGHTILQVALNCA